MYAKFASNIVLHQKINIVCWRRHHGHRRVATGFDQKNFHGVYHHPVLFHAAAAVLTSIVTVVIQVIVIQVILKRI